MNHYVYLIIDTDPKYTPEYYIGVRSCRCSPNIDSNYMGSVKSQKWKDRWKTITEKADKIILEEFASREEAVAYEIKLHSQFNVAINSMFYNEAKQTAVEFDTTGKPSPNKGKPINEKTKTIFEEANKNRIFTDSHRKKISEAMTGRYVSEEARENMSKAQKGKSHTAQRKNNIRGSGNPNAKPIKCIELDKVYDTVTAAARDQGISAAANICNALNGRCKTCNGYHWEYIDK